MDSSGKAQDRAPWESVGMLPAAYLRQKLTKPLPSVRLNAGGSSKNISFLVAEAHEKLDKSFFTRKFGPRLRVEIGAAEFDPKRVWAALNFPCPYRWAAAGACHHEIFVWA